MSYNHRALNSFSNNQFPGTVPTIKNLDPRNQIGLCNFCASHDIVMPVHSLNLCPRCMNRGKFFPNQYVVMAYGRCDLCKTYVVGAIGHIRSARCCFRCLWTKLAHRSDALRPNGTHLV